MSVPVSVHQPAPDRTLAVWLDWAPDLSSTDSTQAHCVDGDHQPTDLVVGFPGCSVVWSIEADATPYAGLGVSRVVRLVGWLVLGLGVVGLECRRLWRFRRVQGAGLPE
jgi:hypothetical protein